MKINEAIEFAKKIVWTAEEMPLGEELMQDVRDFTNMAIEALEKQIPKKPDEYYDGYADGFPVIEYTCPNCGRDVDDTDHHCVCGQTLNWDWSDEE